MVKREDVVALLATCEQIHKPNYGVIAECCRAWLTLDAAPVGHVVGQSGPDISSASTGAIVQMDDPASVKGQRVRLVATPTPDSGRGR